MSEPSIKLKPEMSSQKMWVAGGVFIGVAVVAVFVYFLVFKKSPKSKSDACMGDQDCKNGDVCISKMCVGSAPHIIHSAECNSSSECKPSFECKNQKCVVKPQPQPQLQPQPQPQPQHLVKMQQGLTALSIPSVKAMHVVLLQAMR